MDMVQCENAILYHQALNGLFTRYSKEGSTLFRKVENLDDFKGYAGIYILCFPSVNGFYVGKSQNIARRIPQHFSTPRTEFDRSFSFDEIDSIYVLHCDRDLLDMAEVDCIASIPKEYLLNRMAGGPFVTLINSEEYIAEKFLLKDKLLQWLIDGAENARENDKFRIREERKFKELQKAARLIKQLRPSKITYEISLNAINYQGELLEYVPREYMSHEFCLKALGWSSSTHTTLQFIPKSIRDQEIFIYALVGSEKPIETMKLIPPELLTEDFAEELVTQRRSLLNKLPLELQTPRVIQAAQPKSRRKKPKG